MRGLKRFFLCFLVMVLLLPMAVHAQETERNETLEKAIIDSCYYGTKIDISEYDLTYKQMHEIYYAMHDRGQLAWYAEYTYFNYTTDPDTGKLLTFEPKLMPASKYNRATYQQRLEEILQECVLPGMEPWQIALVLHDYLIVHAAYDESLNERNGYQLLTNGKTVCAGYTEVYRELMNMAGVPCMSVASDPMNHIWNLVQIDGNWYHVDVTWDDPTPDSHGYVGHEFFLLTDEQISAGDDPHYDWVTDVTCTDDSFTDWFFRDVESAISFTDSDTCYYLREKKFQNHIYKRTISTGKETPVYKEKDVHANAGKGDYYYQHFGLSLWNNRLWLNSLNKVVSMDLNGKGVRTEFKYDTKKNRRFILGMYVDKDTIRYTTAEHTGYYEKRKEVLEPSGYHEHAYTQTVVPPSCGVAGYTQSECSCGILCQSTPVAPLTHEWERSAEKNPTLTAEGFVTESCIHCGESRTETLPKQAFKDWLKANTSVVLAVIGGALALMVLVIALTTGKKKKRTPSPIKEAQVPAAEEPEFAEAEQTREAPALTETEQTEQAPIPVEEM